MSFSLFFRSGTLRQLGRLHRPFLLLTITVIIIHLPRYQALSYRYVPPEYTYTESLNLVSRPLDNDPSSIIIYGTFDFSQTLKLSSSCTLPLSTTDEEDNNDSNHSILPCQSLLTDTQHFPQTITSLFENEDMQYVSLSIVRGHYPSSSLGHQSKKPVFPRIHTYEQTLPKGLTIQILPINISRRNTTDNPTTVQPSSPLNVFSFRNELNKLNILSCSSLGGSAPSVLTGSGGILPGQGFYPPRLWYSYPCVNYTDNNVSSVIDHSYCMNIPGISLCNEQFITLMNDLLPCHFSEEKSVTLTTTPSTSTGSAAPSSSSSFWTSQKVGLGPSLLYLPTLLDTDWLAFTLEAKARYCPRQNSKEMYLCSLDFRSRISRTWVLSTIDIQEYTRKKINFFGTLFWGKDFTNNVPSDEVYLDDELCPLASKESIVTIYEEEAWFVTDNNTLLCTAAKNWLPEWYRENRILCSTNHLSKNKNLPDTTDTLVNHDIVSSSVPPEEHHLSESNTTPLWLPDCIRIHRRYSSLHYGYGSILYTISSLCQHNPYSIRIHEILPWIFTRIESSYTVWKSIDHVNRPLTVSSPDLHHNNSSSQIIFNVSVRQLHAAIERGTPEVIELGALSIEAYETVYINYRIQVRSIFHVDEYPPDANRGIDIPGAIVYLCTVSNDTDSYVPMDNGKYSSTLPNVSSSYFTTTNEGNIFPKFPPHNSSVLLHYCSVRVTVPLIMDIPLPDFSMPYNVITLISTLLAFTLGTMVNILARVRKKPVK